MCDRYHFGLVGCKIVKYISRYWQPCKSIAAAWRPDPANHASARDHAPLPRHPHPPQPVRWSSSATASLARLAGPHQYVWMGRQRRTCGTKNGEDLYETKVGYPMEGGCRDENEIRKRERDRWSGRPKDTRWVWQSSLTCSSQWNCSFAYKWCFYSEILFTKIFRKTYKKVKFLP